MPAIAKALLTESPLYNIPVSLVDAYRGRRIVVRSAEPATIVAALSNQDCDTVAYVQIVGLGAPADALSNWTRPIPLELMVERPEEDFPLLYRYSPLLADRPVRVSMPLAPGLGKAVKLATSLEFAVKLEGGQPEPCLAEELLAVAQDYLHRPGASVPVEFIHSVFLAYYRQEPINLWRVQEEDPRENRYVSDDGKETVAKRFAGMTPPPDLGRFLERFVDGLIADGRECSACPHVDRCAGYFKWPDMDYHCDGVKALFRMLADSAQDLRRDLASFAAKGAGLS